MLAGPLPAWAAATIGVGLAALLTGGMHSTRCRHPALGGRDRERRLEIMRDHSIGAFWAVALVLLLLLEVSVRGELGARDLALVSFAPPARSRAGRRCRSRLRSRTRGTTRGRPLARDGISLAAVLVRLAWRAGIAAIALGAGAGAALGAAAGVALLLGLFYRRWLGGVTGDALGAAWRLRAACLVAACAVA